MQDSILVSVKKALGIQADYDGFDNQIIIGINSAIFNLYQMGIGTTAFVVSGIEETWSTLLTGSTNMEAVKLYVVLSTRMVFDPPGTSFLIEATNKVISELGWRITMENDIATP